MRIEILPISLDDSIDLLECLNDASSVAEIFEVIEFSNDIDPVHYKLRWGDADHVVDNVWTFPNKDNPKDWLVENARDSKIYEWVWVWFMTLKAHSRFMTALGEAVSGAEPKPQPQP